MLSICKVTVKAICKLTLKVYVNKFSPSVTSLREGLRKREGGGALWKTYTELISCCPKKLLYNKHAFFTFLIKKNLSKTIDGKAKTNILKHTVK